MNEVRRKRMIALVDQGRLELGKSARRIMGRELEYEALDMIEELLNEVDDMPGEIAFSRLKQSAKDLMQEFKDLRTATTSDNEKYLGWFIATIRDTLAYNEYDKIDLDMISKCFDEVEDAEPFTKEAYEKIHARIDASGLSLLPTTDKIIDKLEGQCEKCRDTGQVPCSEQHDIVYYGKTKPCPKCKKDNNE